MKLPVPLLRTPPSRVTPDAMGKDVERPFAGQRISGPELDELFERYGRMVFRRAATILGNPHDAEEATQEVFIRALRGAQRFENRAEVSTWLYRITTNYCLNSIRDRKRRRELIQENVPAPTPHVSSPQKMMLVRQILAVVDEDCAQAAIYVHVDGMTHLEASEVLGVSRRTVGNLLTRFATAAEAMLASRRAEGGSNDG